MANPLSLESLFSCGLFATQGTFIVLKLTRDLDWSWWVVFLPFESIIGMLVVMNTIESIQEALRVSRDPPSDPPPDGNS